MPGLRWPDLCNARDLGGIPTVEGGRIRERALVRTDNHDRLNPAGLAAIRCGSSSPGRDPRPTHRVR